MISASELWACTGCGSVFMPGTGPDNIMEDDNPNSGYGAYRDGPCPDCGELNPPMKEVHISWRGRP